MGSTRRALVSIALAACAFVFCGEGALAAASVSVSISSGTPVVWVIPDVTNAALAPNTGVMTGSITVTTTAGGGGGTVAISAPANFAGTGGSTIDLGLIKATCARGTAGTWFVPASAVTIVPGGTSAACATILSNESGKTGTFTVSFTINDRYDSVAPIDADTWEAVNNFSIVATAN